MAYAITSKCISCDRCETVCPTNAIQVNDQQKWIDPNLCNNCVGYYGTPQCAAGCPITGGCVPDLSNFISPASQGDYWQSWFNIHDRLVERLHQSKRTRYWEQWFKAYAETFNPC
ncbi:MAG TPA: 4Fe-4S binding protein [Oculatellaceae cyanobacterium]